MNDLNLAFDTSSLSLTGAGTSTYVRELMKALAGLGEAISISEFSYKNYFSRESRLLRTIDTINRELIWQQFILPARAKRGKATILHAPAALSPINSSIPVVYTVHDTYAIRSPKSFSLWHSFIVNRLFPKCIEKADKLIAVSHFTKQEILALYPYIPEEKIVVTHHGVNKIFSIVDSNIKSKIKSKYKFDRPFILSVSTIEPRKNLKTLLQAYSKIMGHIDHDLILTGAYGWKTDDLYQMINRLGLSGRVKFTGYVPLNDLPAIYSLADLFVYPSLYEGFGLPPLEAMACGCPVITSNVASLPEVVGDAAETVDPLDIDALAYATEKLLHDSAARDILVDKGLRRVRQFTWEQCARDTLSVYRSL